MEVEATNQVNQASKAVKLLGEKFTIVLNERVRQWLDRQHFAANPREPQ